MLCLHVMSVYHMHAYCLQRPGNEPPGTAGVRKIVSATSVRDRTWVLCKRKVL